MALKRPYRLRPIHRKMAFETFERSIPWRAGWKREYYGGSAHVRPSYATCIFELELELGSRVEATGVEIRPVRPFDGPELLAAFLDAFRYAPDYCGYPMAAYRKAARDYFEGFFGEKRGEWCPNASCVALDGDRIAAAALVKIRGDGPLLDCLFSRPDRFRNGLATAAATFAVNRLASAGHRTLKSCASLANESSNAWHARFGFVELPNWMTAQSRYLNALRELERRKKWGRITLAEEAAAAVEIAALEHEYDRIRAIKEIDFKKAMPLLD